MEKTIAAFARLGYRLEKFKGFYGLGWYFIKEEDLAAGYTDWKYAGDPGITLKLLEETENEN